MSYLNANELSVLKESFITDPVDLQREYRSRKLPYYTYSVSLNQLDDRLSEGWVIEKKFKTKVKIKIDKPHNVYFEDQIWCFFYESGFRMLNRDSNLKLKYGIKEFNKQQIDVIAINEDVVFIVECKSSQNLQSYSYKKDLESLGLKKDGYRKCLREVLGADKRIKLVFATNNQIISKVDKQRLEAERAFHLDNDVFTYMTDLIKVYKNAAIYQIMATFFKGEIINQEKIKVPAIRGKMGDQRYYMFSIQPHHLLKIGFVSHRTRANKLDMPTYQRLIVPSRLKKLNQFIEDENGYFPNSVIINFDSSEHALGWEEGSKEHKYSNTTNGTLLIPNSYGFAYIIDGQHRIYGYANTSKLHNHTIPVVAFENLETKTQLDMFLKINQNQKAISKNLRITLEKDVYWNSPDLKLRMDALNSGIISYLGSSKEPLRSLITIGEDKSVFSMDNFRNAIRRVGLIPSVTKNNYTLTPNCLYDIRISNTDDAMDDAMKRIGDLISELYSYIFSEYPELFVAEHKLIYSNRANYALVFTLGEINGFLTREGKVDINTTLEERWFLIEPYIDALFESYRVLDVNELSRTLSVKGQGAEKAFAMLMLSLVNTKHSEFTTADLEIWKETMDKELQDVAAEHINTTEELLKKMVFFQLENLFGESYEYEVKGSIVQEATKRADDENRNNHKQGVDVSENKLIWEDMLNISDYKEIIRAHWGKRKDGAKEGLRFQDLFSYDVEKVLEDGNISFFEIGKVASKEKGTKWIDELISCRNKVAHRATRADGLDKKQVNLVENIFHTISIAVNLIEE